MKLLRSWLQDWINLTDIDDTDLSTALESLGFEIEDYKLINPDYKDSFYSSNKNWGFNKYQELTTMLSKDYHVVRIQPGGKYKEPPLKDATNIKSEDVRKSVAIMSLASGAVGYDGLMNHVTAGFKIPMVVICGGLVDESIVGYETSEYIKYDQNSIQF